MLTRFDELRLQNFGLANSKGIHTYQFFHEELKISKLQIIFKFT